MSYLDQITVGSTTYDIQDSNAQRETITGSGAPTTSTVGTVGLHYFNTSATAPPYEYICTNVSGNTYTWLPAGYGEAGSSGVYYGTTQPSDSNITVWIDPSGDADGGGLPSGGSVGDFLIKSSSIDFAAAWTSTLQPTGNIILTNNVHYYTSASALPNAGIAGRIAFVKA